MTKLVKLNNTQNSTTNNTGTGFYNFTGSSVFGQFKRFRKLDQGGWYIDFVAASGKKTQGENSRRDFLLYSSLRVVNKSDIELLEAVDQHTNGALSSISREDNQCRAIINIGDLNVRGYKSQNSDKYSSVAVGSLLRISHLSVGDEIFTGDSDGVATNPVEILNAQKALLNPLEFFNPQEFDKYQAHTFQGVGFINKAFIIKGEDGEDDQLRLSVQFLYRDKTNPNKTRSFVYVGLNSELAQTLVNEYKEYSVTNKEDEVYMYDISKGRSCFFAGTVNVFNKKAWEYNFEKDGKNISGIATALEANLLKVSYMSAGGETIFADKANEILSSGESLSTSEYSEYGA